MTENSVQSNVQAGDGSSSVRKAGAFIQLLGLNMLMVGLLALLAFLAWQRFINKQAVPVFATAPRAVEVGQGENVVQPAENDALVELSPMQSISASTDGVMRKIDLKTVIPSRPRTDVITYTVQAGDTLFSIADNFSLKPETVLWGNFEVLNDNPHLLKPKQALYILPVNGTYYQWQEGDTLSSVASFFKVDPEDIINYSGNFLDLTQADENSDAGIEPGTWVIVPGGKRAIKDWGPPAITRQNAASARYYGEGHCGEVYEGAYGTGTFVWPTTDHSISGYAYDPGVHPAIDIGGQVGNPIYATDSGVVVYAGWSDYGYGLLIVIDHGNGWQSAYAHLSTVAVGCGQSVYQGGYIGALGSTGNSSGPHLHFELVINGAKVNPLDYVR
ncbi:MAG: M23 family metallopeptidase [Anaerolineales bacterium]|nr:M23 family metallopeptidase [Anaerolineales bacterium]